MKIYIAGGVTDVPDSEAQFKRASLKIQCIGHVPVHTLMLPEGLSEQGYMDIAMAMIREVDAIYCLPNWKTSVGAFAEVAYAKKLHLPVFHNIQQIKHRFRF
ncbi:TPA: DUF4406 domain-containing protein [Vibrio parahaemolyticus]|uniref:DUF4406 domain-containing protein n=1 Tax=Vibrio parahaemolyticus TaxID=670 RepID=UPI0004145828|nr:DUF4406 domain-containing protein [Vibrio parahaemolyticus]